MADLVSISTAVGWVISPIISKLINRGFSYLNFDASEKLNRIQSKVVQLELMLEAVEASPNRDRLEHLFKELKSAFYDAEDILDDVEYHRLERKIVSQPDDKLDPHSMAPHTTNWVKKLQSALPKCPCLESQRSGSTSIDAHMPHVLKMELKKILEKIENTVNEAHQILNLPDLLGVSDGKERQTVAVTTSVPPPVVIGRDEDRDKIIAMLHEKIDNGQRKANAGLCYSVIGIHGIPGSGKSTLAQHVCASEKKDKREEKDGHFNLIMWIHVSRNFSVDKIFREMLEEATGNPCPQFKSLDILEQKLEEALSGKHFLLVLDDVWYREGVNQQELQKVISPLKVGDLGSKILLTSRSRDALLALGAIRCIPISDLDDNVFLQLFLHYALEGAEIDERERTIFEEIGSDIAKKLKRSPLAARTVGGQLRIRPNADFWRDTRDRGLLDATTGALWWSYQHLDEQIRRCFAYCSIFPRRHRLKRDKLINLWVAEGFISTTNAGEEMEDVGQRYFDELLSASFLQLVEKQTGAFGVVYYYTVHDLLHDLADKIAKNDCFRIENGWTGVIPRDVRYLFIETYNKTIVMDKILQIENLRTLIIYSDKLDMLIEENVLESMFTRLRKLRVLRVRTVTQSGTLSFPASIGQLKHLRYLAFWTSSSVKQVLPRTFSKLYHMQLLDTGHCRNIVFPSGEDTVNLINLRHIVTFENQKFPDIRKLTSLQTLSFFTVKKGLGYDLQQLTHLNKLRGRLQIHGLENVQNKEQAVAANLAAKERLKELILVWDGDNCSPDIETEVIEGLCPPMELERLELRNYHGLRYPHWMVRKQNGLKNLRELKLYKCGQLGPPPELFEIFDHLCVLSLSQCSWDALPDNMEHLNSLQKLNIFECQNIRSLPMLPQSLLHFELRGCDQHFTRSCKTIGHPNWQKIQHIPSKEVEQFYSQEYLRSYHEVPKI